MPDVTNSLIVGQRRTWALSASNAIPDNPLLNYLPPLVRRLLSQRNLAAPRDVQTFLDISPSLFNDPFRLPDMDIAVERMDRAIAKSEKIAIYGDFDADGVTGAALMAKALDKNGASLVTYLPHRVREGHGLNRGAIEALHSSGTSVIVTVDCGVTDVDSVAYAGEIGMDVIITDHHTVGPIPPSALAIINPSAPGSEYPFRHLTGVGMALKVSQALLEHASHEYWSHGLMELAAIGTITDMAPLVEENRYIVGNGLRELRNTGSIGLRALLAQAGIDPLSATAETIGFTIGPRLNAAGRLGHSKSAYNLLMTSDQHEASALAIELAEQNTLRREMTTSVLESCKNTLSASSRVPPVIVVGDESYNPGVCGLVAGRLVEEYGVPAVVYSIQDGQILASCRGIEQFHWAHALASTSELLNRHGGHAQAAGFTCDLQNLEKVTQRLESAAAEWGVEDARPAAGIIHAEVNILELMGDTTPFLEQMEPFGLGNPTPIFLTRNMVVENVQPMGKGREHFRAKLRSQNATWEAVAFRQTWVPGTTRIDIIYSLTVDTWNGESRLRLLIHDFVPLPS